MDKHTFQKRHNLSGWNVVFYCVICPDNNIIPAVIFLYFLNHEKKVETLMVNNSTNINKMKKKTPKNPTKLSPQTTEYKRSTFDAVCLVEYTIVCDVMSSLVYINKNRHASWKVNEFLQPSGYNVYRNCLLSCIWQLSWHSRV